MFAGISPWGRMLKVLVAHGFTWEQLASRAGTNKQYLQHVIAKKADCQPNHHIGSMIRKLYATHVGEIKI